MLPFRNGRMHANCIQGDTIMATKRVVSPNAPDWLRNKNRTYTNVLTGETISRRQYDKRFGVLFESGFNSYEARQKAEKYAVEAYPKHGSVHHIYDLGIPNDLKRAIETTIDKSPHFGTKMAIAVEVEVYGDGKPYKRWVGSNVWKKVHYTIDDMLKELDDALVDYDIEYVVLGYALTFIDRLN